MSDWLAPTHHLHVDRRGAGNRADAIIAGHSVLCAEMGTDPACTGPEAPAFDISAIRARALADPGKPAGSCRWCGTAALANCLYAPPSSEDIACADRAALVAELDRLRAAIADFIKRTRGTVHGQRIGDADEVLG